MRPRRALGCGRSPACASHLLRERIGGLRGGVHALRGSLGDGVTTSVLLLAAEPRYGDPIRHYDLGVAGVFVAGRAPRALAPGLLALDGRLAACASHAGYRIHTRMAGFVPASLAATWQSTLTPLIRRALSFALLLGLHA